MKNFEKSSIIEQKSTLIVQNYQKFKYFSEIVQNNHVEIYLSAYSGHRNHKKDKK